MFFHMYVFQQEEYAPKIRLNHPEVIMVNFEDSFLKERAKRLNTDEPKVEVQTVYCRRIEFVRGIPQNLSVRIASISGKPYEERKEAYAILAEKECIRIYGTDRNGLLYGLSTLEKLIEEEELTELFLYDYPVCSFRGYRVFVPGRNEIDIFKKMIDTILFPYKYNYIVIELGGAMEYKRHPEINRRWEEYSREVKAFPGSCKAIQHNIYPWVKNTVPIVNGLGTCLTQDEMKDIVNYCLERGIQAIPEVPTLSHANYLVITYPWMNERKEDLYPDTYCPSNPRTYELVFDLLDEIIDVFEPEYVHIGHDEIVSLGICEVCAKKDPVDLITEDITKFHDYLRNRGIKTIIYCDKLLNLLGEDGKTFLDSYGKPCGGGQGYEKGAINYVPATYPIISRLPEDILIFHWYWEFDEDFDRQLLERYQVVFANTKGNEVNNWEGRIKAGISGACCANWAGNAFRMIQRNLHFMDLFFTAYLLWAPDYTVKEREAVFDRVSEEIVSYFRKNILQLTEKNRKDFIRIVHQTDYFIPFDFFYGEENTEGDTIQLGEYIISYQDASSEAVPVKYGENISWKGNKWDSLNRSLVEVIGSTRPISIDGIMYYEWIFKNPFPEKEIKEILFSSLGKANVTIRQISKLK